MSEFIDVTIRGHKDDPDGALLSLCRNLLHRANEREDELQARNDRQALVIKERQIRISQLESHLAALRGQRDAYAEALGKLGEVVDAPPADEEVKHST